MRILLSRLLACVRSWFIALMVLASCQTANAQWVTESFSLKPGWNAIWMPLNVDHEAMDTLVDSRIVEIHKWNNYQAGTFTTSPAGEPSQVTRQWEEWHRGDPSRSTFSSLVPNVAYLVRVDAAARITWTPKGKPVPPRYDWTSTGVNLMGFPLRPDSTAVDRNIKRFFEYDSVLQSPTATKTFYYNGGPLIDSVTGASTNPIQASTNFDLKRFEAYWVRAEKFTDYYGPINVDAGADGLAFGTDGSNMAVRVKNASTAGNKTITVTFTVTPSEAPPSGQPAITGIVPLRLRGSLNLATGIYDSTAVNPATPLQITLAPGESEELVFTLDRSQLGTAAGLQYASILRVTDDQNISRFDIPVSAQPTPRAGLWAGAAVLTQVDNIDPISFTGSISGTVLTVTDVTRGFLRAGLPITGTNVAAGTTVVAQLTNTSGTAWKKGTYTVSTSQTVSSNPMAMFATSTQGTPSPFTERLVIHQDSQGAVRLLQSAVIGKKPDNTLAVAASEGSFTAGAALSRMASVHFPKDTVASGAGSLGTAGDLTFTVDLGHNDDSNPFVHRYHPDHDNLDERFETTYTVPGKESNRITRSLKLSFISANPIGFDPAWGGTTLGGNYEEIITGLRSLPIVTRGAFVLQRASDAAAFIPAP